MVDIASLAWTQFLSLFDLGNPFSVYFWVACLSLIIRAVLVLFPLKHIYDRWMNKDPKVINPRGNFFNRMREIVPFQAKRARNRLVRSLNNKDGGIARFLKERKKDVDLGVGIRSQTNQVREVIGKESFALLKTFIKMEILIAIAPLFLTLLARILFGSPSVNPWTWWALAILAFFYFYWFMVQLRRSYKLRSALEPLQRHYADPLLVKTGLGATLWSRAKLEQLSKANVPEISEYPDTQFRPITKRNDFGKSRPDVSGMVNNAKEVGSLLSVAIGNTKTHLKQFRKDSAEYGKEKLESTIDTVSNNFIEDNFISSRPAVIIMIHLFNSLSPVIAIYGLNWFLGVMEFF